MTVPEAHPLARPALAPAPRASDDTGDSVGARSRHATLVFAQVYEDWFAPVCRWLRALGGPGLDVEDLAQEVFVVVDRKLSAFDGQHLGPWLYRISANTASDARRRAWFKHLFLGRSDEPLEDLACVREDPAELLERKQGERILYRLLAQLPEKRRRALILAEIEGRTGDEIARLEGIPVATARTRLFHARREFLQIAAKHRRQERP